MRSHTEERPGTAPRRIMILEDEPLVALELQMIVEDMGHTVTSVADNQADAVAQAERDEPDLIIADIQLRQGSGTAAAEAIFRRRQVPLIVVSGNQVPAHLAGGRHVRFLAKPFRVEALRRAIEEALADSD